MTIISGSVIANTVGVTNNALKVTQTDSAGVAIDTRAGFQSTGNSTTTILGASVVYTGAGIDVTGYSSVYVTIVTPQSSTVNGVEFQGSYDNSVFETFKTFTNAGGGLSVTYSSIVPFKFFRVRYTNNVTAQTAFKLDTFLKIASFVATTTFDNRAAGQQMSVITGVTSTAVAVQNILSAPPANLRNYIHKLTVSVANIGGNTTAATTPVTYTTNGNVIPRTINIPIFVASATFFYNEYNLIDSINGIPCAYGTAFQIGGSSAITNVQFIWTCYYSVGT